MRRERAEKETSLRLGWWWGAVGGWGLGAGLELVGSELTCGHFFQQLQEKVLSFVNEFCALHNQPKTQQETLHLYSLLCMKYFDQRHIPLVICQ